jgi:hypothetical protein
VIPIEIPPLRERPEDVALLAHQFLRRHSPDRVRQLTPAALEALKRRRWEGNARELENYVERVLAFCDRDVIDLGDLPRLDNAADGGPLTPKDALGFALERDDAARPENWYIDEVLRFTGGNKVQLRVSGINRRTPTDAASTSARRCRPAQGACDERDQEHPGTGGLSPHLTTRLTMPSAGEALRRWFTCCTPTRARADRDAHQIAIPRDFFTSIRDAAAAARRLPTSS